MNRQVLGKFSFKGIMLVITTLFSSVFIALGFLSAKKAFAEYRILKENYALLDKQLLQKKRTFIKNRRYLYRILSDPMAKERLMREKWGYVKPNEMVIKFEQSNESF